jgi:AraC-like DNA-binding protein
MSVVAKALWFIEGNYARNPSLDDVARAAGTTRFYLSRSFTWTTGLNIRELPTCQWLRRLRHGCLFRAL